MPVAHPPRQVLPELELTDRTLDPHRQASPLGNRLDEVDQLVGRLELRMSVRRNAVLADGNPPDAGNLGRDLRPGQDSTLARLGTLRELDLDGADPRMTLDHFGESIDREAARVVSRSEITGPQLPDHVGTQLVIRTDTPLAGIVIAARLQGTPVQGRDGSVSQ